MSRSIASLPLAAGLAALAAMLALRIADASALQVLRGAVLAAMHLDASQAGLRSAPAARLEVLLAVIGSLIVIGLFTLAWARTGLLATGLGLAGLAGATWLCWSRLALPLDPSFPAVTLLVVATVSGLGYALGRSRSQAQLRRAFATSLARPHVATLSNSHALDGEAREVTVLHLQVTGLSDGYEAEALLQRMNRILGPLTGRLREAGAYVTHDASGGITAVWNAPLEQPRHGELAARAALGLLPMVRSLAATFANGSAAPAFGIAMGIGTGASVCGSIGAASRPTYAILGAPSRDAARLQQASHALGFPILVSAATATTAPDFASLEIDRSALDGGGDAARFYALIGDETVARSREFRGLKPLLAELEANLKIKAASDVRDILDEMGKRTWPPVWPSLAPLIDHYRRRLA